MTDQRPSDAEPEPDVTPDGALSPGSTADGSGTNDPGDREVPEDERPVQHPDAADPDRLVEGNRVAGVHDME
jgi:hypothetical protein